jgi:AraC-like DNA-binding protein
MTRVAVRSASHWEEAAVRSLPQSNVPEIPFLWTRGIAAREAVRYLDRNGFDAEPLLSSAELSRSQLMQDPGGVSAISQHRFLELAAHETKDPLLGLHVVAEMDLRDIGLLYYLTASCATVAEALDHLEQYAATTTEDVRIEILPQKDETLLTFRRGLLLDEPPLRQHSEMIAFAFNRALCRLTNRDFAPSRMTFAHARSSGGREVHRILRCPVEFVQATDSWVLPRSVMELRIVSEDPHLLQILEAHADDLLSERRGATGLRGVVENHLVSALPSGRVQAAAVAKQLGISERSLRRHLAEEGASFGEVLDTLRQRLAHRYLEDERVSLQQIAWLLGYSEIGAFNHAFKRWTGTSPGRARYARTPNFG